MAYDLTKFEEYKIDYDRLCDIFKNNYRLEFDKFDEWIETWTAIFKNADKDTLIQVKNLKKQTSIPNLEVFSKNIEFGGINIVFNFMVDGVQDYIKKEAPTYTSLPINDFGTKVVYETTTGESTHDLQDPVYLVFFPIGNWDYMVIDGNHRVNSFKKQNVMSIKSLLIKPMEVIKYRILLFSIDIVLYGFIVEYMNYKRRLENGEQRYQLLFDSSNIHHAFKYFNQ